MVSKSKSIFSSYFLRDFPKAESIPLLIHKHFSLNHFPHQNPNKHAESGGCGGPAEDVADGEIHRVNTHGNFRQIVRACVCVLSCLRVCDHGCASMGEVSGRQRTPRVARDHVTSKWRITLRELQGEGDLPSPLGSNIQPHWVTGSPPGRCEELGDRK